ncbi:spermidine/putrescine ABC transporter ATP-binding protein [Nostoc linckia z18]|jgi:spermidine/putrescine transport system ATP-binding protein|uniref:Spermidine/putrescine import ATP-binding protein PotA n=2 Tax=Nostoc linckia TaxID=92942 RepID=A0A9Q5Z7U5_NOSLI|nr:ABC transporter ATP-binding protein [Nostoc linckia]PHK31910.1 spermidine/putrescine ABC transporter ATP-binding protein [Nostoc linckia z15]PHK46408.1 spermidine/putrescine ABC transporter ATP-binding protein [Nostoc linckia z16]PHJ60209.1 spermidine/putrescine ABC transporter ATP-binding protein [Nostoc linckia z1]PHJ63773.1 spermidine/putrescine ABC transporter ATP-binding protein [Nostoc linckia z3]PHJ70787.1 spermidine/putrescine ABC transporter ATP-binding protein [Nostoc linckia z2]
MAQTVMQNQRAIAGFHPLDVELRNVFKFFDREPAVHGIDLEVKQGEFFSILGPSGCGKTTTLRLIAGFEIADTGKVLIQGQSMTNVPPYRRPVNTVFQSYALFNHLNVWDNIAFGLRLKKLRKAVIESRVQEALKLVKMESLKSRFPNQLSGGQQQRVALARALVNRPAVVLLDEPLGALDLKLRKEMQVELSNLHQDLGLTFVMVTHDQEEALSLSDRIAVMNQGKIEQIGTPSEIYERPQTSFVADFIGDTNLFSGEILAVNSADVQILTKTGLSITVARAEDTPSQLSQSVIVSVRPEKIQLSLYPPNLPTNCFEGRLVNVMYLGTHVNYIMELTNGVKINALQPNTFGSLPDRDTPIYAWWAETDCLALLSN